jgi:hypothetical protein
MFGLFKKKSEIKGLIEKRFEDLQRNKTMFCEYASMFAASAIELSKNNSSLSAVTYQDQSLRCLKDPLIFRQCIRLHDIAVLLNKDSYVEQYDRRIEARLHADEGCSELSRQCS